MTVTTTWCGERITRRMSKAGNGVMEMKRTKRYIWRQPQKTDACSVPPGTIQAMFFWINKKSIGTRCGDVFVLSWSAKIVSMGEIGNEESDSTAWKYFSLACNSTISGNHSDSYLWLLRAVSSTVFPRGSAGAASPRTSSSSRKSRQSCSGGGRATGQEADDHIWERGPISIQEGWLFEWIAHMLLFPSHSAWSNSNLSWVMGTHKYQVTWQKCYHRPTQGTTKLP